MGGKKESNVSSAVIQSRVFCKLGVSFFFCFIMRNIEYVVEKGFFDCMDWKVLNNGFEGGQRDHGDKAVDALMSAV